MEEIDQTITFVEADEEVEQGNMFLAFVGALIASVFAAVCWGLLIYIVQAKVGWLMPGIGYFVGKVVHKLGNGKQVVYGVIGAAFALFGCFLGNIFNIVFVHARAGEEIFPGTNRPDEFEFIFDSLLNSFSPVHLILYAITIYFGFTMSYKSSSRVDDVI